ncbi:MAG: hypothetical protein MJ193_03035 [Clostridia bacterium]|nr:hypothetical protein [Clostridia bacterium]
MIENAKYGKNQSMCILYNTPSADAIALNFQEVSAVHTLETDGYIIVAVIPYCVNTQSQRNKLAYDIKSQICEQLQVDNDKVIVTYDFEVFRYISSGNISADKILSIAIERNYPL